MNRGTYNIMRSLTTTVCLVALLTSSSSAVSARKQNDDSGKRRKLPASATTTTTSTSPPDETWRGSSDSVPNTLSKSSKVSTKSIKTSKSSKGTNIRSPGSNNNGEAEPKSTWAAPNPRGPTGNVNGGDNNNGGAGSNGEDNNGGSTTTPATDPSDSNNNEGNNNNDPPTTEIVPGCIDIARYNEIHNDVVAIASRITNNRDRSHFLGGCLRLAAHDFMDYDQHAATDNKMGMDGCLDWTSINNAGLNTIWNEHSELHKLYDNKYDDLSRADFWVAVANAVVKLTSVGDDGLDMMGTYFWGRKDRDVCTGSSERLPGTEDCRQVEGVFLERMGLEWRDAVALLGAHTLGRGHLEFSGHHGTWVPNDKEAQKFDKRYFQELVGRSWTRRIMSPDPLFQDWTTGDPMGGNNKMRSPKMMLNTDICLFWDTDDHERCCTRTDLFNSDGESHCQEEEDNECKLYENDHPRMEAVNSVLEYVDGGNDDNENFYKAFELAWLKATVNGMHDLHPLRESCLVVVE